MIVGDAFDLLLAVLVVAVAAWTVGVHDTFAAVVGVVAFGLLVALVWVRIAAPDVALTEAAIGSGVTGGLLLSATTRIQRAEQPDTDTLPGPLLRTFAVGLCIIVVLALAWAVLSLPEPAPTLAPAAGAALPATGLKNPVAAVLIAFRGVDTLLEVVVLLLATVGMWSLASDGVWGGLPGRRPNFNSGHALTLLALLLLPLGIIVGLHIFWIGSQAPGGEFQASAILAAMWILARMSGLADVPAISRRLLRALLVLGPVVFLAIGFIGFAGPGGFLAYPPRFAKPAILIVEIALMLSIAAMLVLLVAGPPTRRKSP